MVAELPKAVRLNTDAYLEDSDLINKIQADLNLDSRKEAIHSICNYYRSESESEETEKQKCQHLCGEYCSKNAEKIKKVDADYCQACRKSLRVSQREIEERTASLADALRLWQLKRDFFERLGVENPSYCNEESCIAQGDNILAQLDAQFSELRKPFASTLAEIANLKAELEKLAPLENDNDFLKQELEQLKHEPLAEKNAWLTVEIQQRNAEIEKLKTENAKQEATINAYMFQRKTQ